MRIAIDIRRMTDFGVGTYTRNIVRALARLDHHNEYRLLGSPEKIAEIGPLPENFQGQTFSKHDTSVSGYFECRTLLQTLNCDLVHIPHLFWAPRNLPCPYVVTVHDLLEHMYRTHDRSSLRRCASLSREL